MKTIRSNSTPSYEFQSKNNNSKNEILFHSFFTESYKGWAPLYMHSINEAYGFGTKYLLQTVNYNKNLNFLNYNSHDIDIYNIDIDNYSIAKKLGINLEKLNSFFIELKNGNLTSENFRLKLFISVQLRYQSLKNIFELSKKKYDFRYLVHSDIDVYHRTNVIEKLKDRNFDIALFGRGFDEIESGKIQQPLGAYLIFQNSPRVITFFDKWYKIIDSIPFEQWPLNYGQLSLRQALIENLKLKEFIFLDLSNEKDINFSKFAFLKSKEKSDDIWLNSNSKFKKDPRFDKLQKGDPNKLSILTTVQDFSNNLFLKIKKLLG